MLQGEGPEAKGERESGPPDEAGAALIEGGAASWPDEAAETAFQAEARERGEPVVTPGVATEAIEETDSKGLPPLDELVQKISPEARSLLDELFRAKFTAVRRVPAKALKA